MNAALLGRSQDPTNFAETPIKKSKLLLQNEMNTAESPSMHKPTIADIDQDELFNDFGRLVLVSEEDNLE